MFVILGSSGLPPRCSTLPCLHPGLGILLVRLTEDAEYTEDQTGNPMWSKGANGRVKGDVAGLSDVRVAGRKSDSFPTVHSWSGFQLPWPHPFSFPESARYKKKEINDLVIAPMPTA